MTASIPPQTNQDHTRAVIAATLIVSLTCILSCTAVLIVLILRMS